MRAGIFLFVASIATSACDACNAPTSTSTSTSAPSITVALSASAPLPTSFIRFPCRILGPTPPSTPSAADDFKWLDVAAGAKVTAKDPTTARETGFEGPARVRICVEGEEESWIVPLAKPASFTSVRGAGESPGAEEWVVTPIGVVRYVAAMVKVTVTPTGGAIQLTSGTIDVWTAEGVGVKASAVDGGAPDAGGARSDEGWQRFDGASSLVLTAKASTLTDAAAKASVDSCTSAGAKARAIAALIDAPGAPLATLAAQHVVARRIARATCAVARVRTSQLAPSPAAAALAKAAADADAAWRKLGGPADAGHD